MRLLERIIEETRKCLDNECFIAALALSLTIPDICGKAEYPNENANKARYIKWYDTYIGKYEKPPEPISNTPRNPSIKDMPYSSGEIIYSLRNCMLHQGTPNIEESKIKEQRCQVNKFELSIGGCGHSSISFGCHNEITERTLRINLVDLCLKLCATAEGYYNKYPNKFDFFHYELIDMRHSIDKSTEEALCNAILSSLHLGEQS